MQLEHERENKRHRDATHTPREKTFLTKQKPTKEPNAITKKNVCSKAPKH